MRPSHAAELEREPSQGKKMQVIHRLALVSLVCSMGTAHSGGQRCEGPLKRDASDFVALGDGSQVLDKKTRLIWTRCVEDQVWTGSTCQASDPQAVNPGPRLTYTAARSFAASKASATESWRIPTKNELLTLREPGCYNPSLNLKVFPTAPAWSSDGMFWTSTPQARGQALVSAIGASDSWSETGESKTNHVRLVRTAPPETK
jgi:Protein of unknown function (DUF1566)